MHFITFFANITNTLGYIFIDKLSFLSYHHIVDIAKKIYVILGKHIHRGNPFRGMNFVF